MGTFLKNLWRGQEWRWKGPRVVLLFLALAVGSLMFMEDRFIYYPSTYPTGNWDYPSYRIPKGEVGVMITDVWFYSEDGVKLHGWYCQPAIQTGDRKLPMPSRGAVLWCHGNAGNITDRYYGIEPLVQMGLEVFVFDYRGYGRSLGEPSEEGLYRDTTAAYAYLREKRRLKPEQILIKGVSLGGAPATELATREPCAGLVLESTFTSAPDMAAIILPIMPRFMVRSSYNTIDRLPRVTCPVQLIHGDADQTIPYRMGEELRAVAPAGSRFLRVPGADHDDLAQVGGRLYWDCYRDFLRDCGFPDASGLPTMTAPRSPAPP